MASSLLVLLDDIATLLDDVAVLAKAATQKSAGVLGDDLALNAEQVTGFRPERELAVVWAVAKGSFVNKAILVPAALLVSAVAPFLVVPLLMVGGLYLCYEGFEKVAHKVLHGGAEPAKEESLAKQARVKAVADPACDLVALERQKIRGAIRTDFILSAEIIAIALATVAQAPLLTRAFTLVVVGVGVTVGVYGLVGGIVKLDDLGLLLTQRGGAAATVGRGLVRAMPVFMKGLSFLGTAAMFLVGGGILVHGFGLHWGPEIVVAGVAGIIAGGVVVGIVEVVKRILGRSGSQAPSH